jgi:hypothetical protein
MSEIRATRQLVSDETWCLLQHMQPANVFITDCASIRARTDSNPRTKAGLLGKTHTPGSGVCTSEACKNQVKHIILGYRHRIVETICADNVMSVFSMSFLGHRERYSQLLKPTTPTCW